MYKDSWHINDAYVTANHLHMYTISIVYQYGTETVMCYAKHHQMLLSVVQLSVLMFFCAVIIVSCNF